MSFRYELEGKAVSVLLSAAGLLLILVQTLELLIYGWPLRDGQPTFTPFMALIAGIVLLGVGIYKYRKKRDASQLLEILDRARTEVLQKMSAQRHQENLDLLERIEALRRSQVKVPPLEIPDNTRKFARQALKPSVLLVNLGANTDGKLFFAEDFHGQTRRGRGSRDELQQKFKFAAARQQWFESDPEIQEAIRRLQGIGLSVVANSDVTRIVGDVEAYGRLEELAADDAGIIDPMERAQAAEKFRVYMLRNYSKDYLANREKYPDVGGSPYSDPSTWLRDT